MIIKGLDVEETTERDRNVSESSDRCESEEEHFNSAPLLPEVELPTHEEEEEELVKLRAKLYRFDTSSEEGPEWKERGTGEVKLLRHRENNSVRVVMRRDKTLKVCANHFITPWMELKPCAGSQKAFVYMVAADFADEQIKSECLAIRFGNIETAGQFKTKFEEGKSIVSSQCKLYNGEGDKENELNSEGESDEDDDESKGALGEKTDEVTEKLTDLKVTEEAS